MVSFRATSHEILTIKISSCVDGKQQQMTENDVEKVWVQNLVIPGWFPTLTGFGAKSNENLTNFFLAVLIGNDKNFDQKEWVCFGWKTKSSWLGFQLC